MGLEFLKKLMKQKQEKRAALLNKSNNSESLDEVRSINEELVGLNDEINELRTQIEVMEAEERQEEQNKKTEETPVEARKASVPVPALNPVGTYGVGAIKRDEEDTVDYEKRGVDLLESRAITIGASNILAPKHDATDIKGTFNQVSSLIDRVTHKPLMGGESYSRPYEMGISEGTYTAEGALPATTEPTFGYAEMTKAKITAYAEETEEVEKLPAARYGRLIETSVRKSVRRKISKEILVGTGATNTLTGIFVSNVIEAASDIEVAAITADTLKEIVYSYGGDEDVEDAAVLILNKIDLKAFAQLKTADGTPYHMIISNGNTGTIDGIPYILNSVCLPISLGTTAAGAYSMAYGSLSNYELALFSDLETKKSTEYKFKEGMVAYRAVIFAGGNVAAHNGFLRVKKV